MKYLKIISVLCYSCYIVLLGAHQVYARPPVVVERAALFPDGAPAGGVSLIPGGVNMSSDGRYILFHSTALGLVPGVTDGLNHAYVRDRVTGQTELISQSTEGAVANAEPVLPVISANGRFVAFLSTATNLVAGDTNGFNDVFLRDRQNGTTIQVNLTHTGAQPNAGAAVQNVFVTNDGRYVAFASTATNLVPIDVNLQQDIFIRDTVAQTTFMGELDSYGGQGNGGTGRPVLTPDGRYLAFVSTSNNLVNGDSNALLDLFWRDLQEGITKRVNINSNGSQANAILTNLVSSMSDDGRYIVFSTTATNLVSGDTNGVEDVFMHDVQTGTTVRISVNDQGVQGNGISTRAFISPNGRYVSFSSAATNLVSGDTNGQIDVFVKDTQTGGVFLASVGENSIQQNYPDSAHLFSNVSNTGDFVVFNSSASNIGGADGNGAGYDVFITRRPDITNTIARADDQEAVTTNVKGLNFVITFGNPIDPATFTCSDIAITATTGYPQCHSITQLEPHDNTVFMIRLDNAARGSTLSISLPAGRVDDADGSFNIATSGAPAEITIEPAESSGQSRVIGSIPSSKTVTTVAQVSVDTLCVEGQIFSPTTGLRCTVFTKTASTSTSLSENVSTPFVFTRDLSWKMTGEDVRQLQIFLNRNGFPVAPSGIGSSGNETTYFGLATKAALARYQLTQGITPAVGTFGPKTRAAVQKTN